MADAARRVASRPCTCEIERTVVAALLGVIERVAGLAIVTTRGSGRLAHLLLAVLEVDRVHGGGRVAQALRNGRVRVCPSTEGGQQLSWRRRRSADGMGDTQWLLKVLLPSRGG